MSRRIIFPFKSSFYFLSLRVGSTVVAAGDGLLSLIRMVLVLTKVQMFDLEHTFRKLSEDESRIRLSALFGLNLLTCILLGVGIKISDHHPWPSLMVPWLVMFMCCTWLYYPNVISQRSQPWPIVISVIVIAVCLYCWCVVLSFFLDILARSTTKPALSDVAAAVI